MSEFNTRRGDSITAYHQSKRILEQFQLHIIVPPTQRPSKLEGKQRQSAKLAAQYGHEDLELGFGVWIVYFITTMNR
jgi:hypothetical protein